MHYCTLGGPEWVNGLYLWDDGPVILLDKRLLKHPRLYKCVLAEEIGHYFTAPVSNLLVVHTSYNREIAMSADERRALKWATDFLIPDHKLLAAMHCGCLTVHELADHFQVTEWFMHRKLGFIYEQRNRLNQLNFLGYAEEVG